jgi:tetratricopeptide (TPR) repeat protein
MKMLVTAMLLFTALGAAAVDTMPATSSVDQLAEARKAIDLKDWDRAVGLLTRAVRSDSGNADAFNLLGFSYRKQGKAQLPKAFEAYREALRLDPRHRGAHEYLGEAYLMNNQPAEAQRMLAQLESLCGNRQCEEYVDLSRAIAAWRGPRP